MLISRDQSIAGLAAPLARDIARKLHWTSYTARALAFETGMRDAEAAVLQEMAAAGVMTREGPHVNSRTAPEEDGSDREVELWRTTIAGNALAKARIGKPMPRERAQRHLDELLTRVDAVNADADGLYWVDVVELFGSLAEPDRVEVGDVDVRVTVSHRYAYEDHEKRRRAMVDASASAGRVFNSMMQELAFPEAELRRRLRGRSVKVDLQLDIGAQRDLPAEARTVEVYRRVGCDPARDGAIRRGCDGEVLPWK